MKTIIASCLIGVAAFGASAAGGFAWASVSHATVASSAEDARAFEKQAHRSAIDYILNEFGEKPMERMQFLGYENAIHAGMNARGAKAIEAAAAELVRAQDCAGIMYSGHRTAITRELVLGLHRATAENPQWNRIIAKASELPSTSDGDPCRSVQEKAAAPRNGILMQDPMIVDRSPTLPPEGRTERMGVFHVKITEEDRLKARKVATSDIGEIRMRLD